MRFSTWLCWIFLVVTHRPLYVKIHGLVGHMRLSHADAIAFVHGGLRGVQLQKLSFAAEEVPTPSIITQGVVLGSWSLTRGGGRAGSN